MDLNTNLNQFRPSTEEVESTPDSEGLQLSIDCDGDVSAGLPSFTLDGNIKRAPSIPISPATSSVSPGTPPSHVLTPNVPDTMRKFRAAAHDTNGAVSRAYKQCALRLGQLCLALPGEDPKDYAHAFANDQSSALNPCGLSVADAQRHGRVLQGFFRDSAAYSKALWSYREVRSFTNRACV